MFINYLCLIGNNKCTFRILSIVWLYAFEKNLRYILNRFDKRGKRSFLVSHNL